MDTQTHVRRPCCILGLSCSLPYLGMPIYGEPRVKFSVCPDIKCVQRSCVSVF